jgi:DNA replication protein DnaC
MAIPLAVHLGHRVYFTAALDLTRRMARALAENRLSREIKNLARPKLLISGEVGYLAIEQAHASHLLHPSANGTRSARPSCRPTTTHDWGQVFAGDASWPGPYRAAASPSSTSAATASDY